MSYNPTIGRWISEDPIGFQAADPNLYRYVGNSPTNYTDPSGLQHMSPEAARKIGELVNSVRPIRPPSQGYDSDTGLFNPKPIDPAIAKKWLEQKTLITVTTKEDFDSKIAAAPPGTAFKWVISNGQLRALNLTKEPGAVHPLLSDPQMTPVWTAGRFKVGQDGKVEFNVESNHYGTNTIASPALGRARQFFNKLELDSLPVYTSKPIK